MSDLITNILKGTWSLIKGFFGLFTLSNKFNEFSQKTEDSFKELNNKHQEIREALIKYGLIEPFTRTQSLKKITERGQELLKKYNTDDYLKTHCDLLKDKELKNQTDVDIFIKCSQWVNTEVGQKQAIKIILHSNINKEQCNELLALAIMEKIKSKK